MNARALLALFLFVGVAAAQSLCASPPLRVSDNGRFLVHADGSPFFYLADTAWELFHRLNRDETDLYLRNRADKHFTVIQAVVLAEFDGLTSPNAYGDLPLTDNDPAKPNEAYFKHVDYVVDKAASLGLVVGMLPTWGDKVNKKWGKGPEVFTPENAGVYGEFLGKRYKDKPIIWILGGDRPIDNDRHMAIWRGMAAGVRKGDGGQHLISYHPNGETHSARWLHAEPWLDFNMLQSGHARHNGANYAMIAEDYARTPAKPILDAEADYEDHPVNWKTENGWFDEYDVRKTAYWALFAGACGHTYGCHDIWQFLSDAHPPVTRARTPWKKALDLPAAGQMQFARSLIESRPYLTRVPDQGLIVGDAGKGGDHVQATRDAEGSYAMVYLPSGKPVTIETGKLSGQALRAWWFDPRTGKATAAGEFAKEARREFTSPEEGKDWVLVIDDARRKFPVPGARD